MSNIQINLKIDEVYTFKLNSGEEVVAKVKQAGGDWILINDPVSVAPGPQGMGLMPTLFTANPESETRLNTNSIAVVAETESAVKSKYIQATTGLTVPDKKLILG
jgi:hypothetical protein